MFCGHAVEPERSTKKYVQHTPDKNQRLKAVMRNC